MFIYLAQHKLCRFCILCFDNSSMGIGIGGKVHSSSELRVFRHLWSRSDAPCSSSMYQCYYVFDLLASSTI